MLLFLSLWFQESKSYPFAFSKQFCLLIQAVNAHGSKTQHALTSLHLNQGLPQVKGQILGSHSCASKHPSGSRVCQLVRIQFQLLCFSLSKTVKAFDIGLSYQRKEYISELDINYRGQKTNY